MEKKVYLAPDAVITGDVSLGENVNIWYGAVLRGDSGKITVGRGTNIQEKCVLHEETTLGENCTIGHCAIVHGCTIGDNTLVGMGAIILDGAKIGKNCIVGAGALVTGKMDAPDGSVILGSPAKVVKEATAEQIEANRSSAQHYIQLAQKGLPTVEKT
jgi:carbonic anhydrase/acetyltransferase-like protein (isoleucine patch superfamily)